MQVVLYDQNSPPHKQWSDQFVNHDSWSTANRKRVPLNGNQTVKQLVDTIVGAAKDARGGDLIFAVGHGGTASSTGSYGNSADPTTLAQGFVDLAPKHKLRLGRGAKGDWLDPFYNYVFPHPGLKSMSDMDQDQNLGFSGGAQRLINWHLYQQIGTAIKTNGVNKVTFLTCNIGNASNFVKKIALDWNVVIRAYKRYVWFVGSKPVRVCLDGDQNGGPTNTPDAEYQLPAVDYVLIGPPLPRP
jgi:hypothetical protein